MPTRAMDSALMVRATARCARRFQEANATDGDNRIVLPAGTYTLTIAGAGEDAAATGDLDITDVNDMVTIVGAGAGVTIIDGGGIDRVFDALLFCDLTLEDLTVRGGNETNGDGGGAIHNDQLADITVRRCEFDGNSSTGQGGAIDIFGNSNATIVDSLFTDNVGVSGQAVHSNGGTVIRNSTFSGNGSATYAQVSNNVSGNLLLDSSTVTGGFTGIGGGGTFRVRNTLITDNSNGSINFARRRLLHLGRPQLPRRRQGHRRLRRWRQRRHRRRRRKPGVRRPGAPARRQRRTHSDPRAARRQPGAGRRLVQCRHRDPRPARARASSRHPERAGRRRRCDIGAFESETGQSLSAVEVPIRWCGVRGAPSIENPALVGATSANQVLRERHERAAKGIFQPQGNIVLRSAAQRHRRGLPAAGGSGLHRDEPRCVHLRARPARRRLHRAR